MKTLITKGWSDYELLDTGEGAKLERFGIYVLNRPEPKALWSKTLDATEWQKAHATYIRNSSGGGSWNYASKLPSSWNLTWNKLKFHIQPTGFKHTGIFPEQSPLWNLIQEKCKQRNSETMKQVTVLNLFAYTGGSTLAALSAGAKVTHVDSAKEMLDWARKNVTLSGLENKPVRWIPEDVIRFVQREIKRGNKYDAIIMDPPKFGRGSKGEVWKIEDDLSKLVEMCTQILTNNPAFFLINAYAVSYSSITLHNILTQAMKNYRGSGEHGELAIEQKSNHLLLPTSIFSLWSSQTAQ